MTSTDLAVAQLSGAVDLDIEEFIAVFELPGDPRLSC